MKNVKKKNKKHIIDGIAGKCNVAKTVHGTIEKFPRQMPTVVHGKIRYPRVST